MANRYTKLLIKRKTAAFKEFTDLVIEKGTVDIPVKEINKIASKNKLDRCVFNLAVQNITTVGVVNRSYKHGRSKMPQMQKIMDKYTKKRKLYPAQAARLVLAWMNSKEKSREFCNKHHIYHAQLYALLREIEITGKLMGRQILDPNNYSKPKVCDVIHYYKYPKTNAKRITNLSPIDKMMYQRVAQVLIEYLSKAAYPRKNKTK